MQKSAFDPNPLVTGTAVILPAALGFGALIMAIASPAEGVMKYAMLGGAILLSVGLNGLFSLLARQQRQLLELREQLEQALPPSGDSQAS